MAKTCPGECRRAWHAARHRTWRKNNPDKVAALRVRTAQLRQVNNYSLTFSLQKHNTTPEWYEATLLQQGGKCGNPGCARTAPGGPASRNWHIDHDHTCCPGEYSCGKCIRGLLCRSCNVGLGNFNDDVAVLRGAIEYLEAHVAG